MVANRLAARGGLQQGDVIVRVNGQPVTPDQTVSYLVANTPVELAHSARDHPRRQARRPSTSSSASVRPRKQLAKISGGGDSGTQGAQGGTTAPQKALGLSLAPTPELARAANLPPTARGVIITAVDPNSDAGDEGLQRGDLIVSINNQLVTTPAQVVAAIDNARRTGRSSVLLLVKRGTSPEAFVGVDISGK